VKPPPFTYHRPADLIAAARMLAELGEGAKVLAGGQSLIPLMNFRLAAPEHLVDVNHLGLDAITMDDGEMVIGATVRHAHLLRDPDVAAVHPLVAEAAGWIAHAVIRNRGTVCGSLAHGDPAAELPAVLALLDGSVEVVAWRAGRLVTRRVTASDLFLGPLETSLAPDELAVAARFPLLGARTGWALDELARRKGDYALAGVALSVTVDSGGEPVAARAAFLSCAPTPVVVELSPAVAGGADLYDLVAGALDPTDDIHATGAYRRHLAATLAARAVPTALARARETAEVPA
jgi:carbon-monoxide dehydrogenase medium subunit